MGGLFVNYYNNFGRTWQVYVESEAPFRADTGNLGQFYVRNNQGEALPLSALARFETRSGPEFTMRRSEEHTSELQSRLHLVCRLLLEKKKKRVYTRLQHSLL